MSPLRNGVVAGVVAGLISCQVCTLALRGNLCSQCWQVFLNWQMKGEMGDFPTSQRLQDSSIDSRQYQHFCNVELRREVEQDVVRVFTNVKEILGNVLFHCARCHPDQRYRQVQNCKRIIHNYQIIIPGHARAGRSSTLRGRGRGPGRGRGKGRGRGRGQCAPGPAGDNSNSSTDDEENNVDVANLFRKSQKEKKAFEQARVWSESDLGRVGSQIPEFEPDPNMSECEYIKSLKRPYDFYRLYYPENYIDHVVEQSKIYAIQKGKPQKANAITNDIVMCGQAAILLSGYCKFPQRRMYWEESLDTNNQLLKQNLRRDTFETFLEVLHFTDNLSDSDSNDRFKKVRPIFDNLNRQAKRYAPQLPHMSVDECMVPYYGECPVSCVPCRVSRVACRVLCVPCRASRVVCPVSRVPCRV